MSKKKSKDCVTYLLRDETDTLVGLLALAAHRFRQQGVTEPVSVVELAYWLEGSRLGVFFIADPEYECYGQAAYDGDKVYRSGGRASYVSFFEVPSWALLYSLAVRAEPPQIQVLDRDGAEVPANSVRSVSRAVGQNLLNVAVEARAVLLAGLSVAEPLWLVTFEDDDNDEWQLARVTTKDVVVYPNDEVELSQQWFAAQSASLPKGSGGKKRGGRRQGS